MKGIVFNIFQKFVEENIGEEEWEDVLEETGFDDDVFVAPKTYKDEDFLSIVTKTIEKFKLVPEQAIHSFGKFSFPILISKIPDLVKQFEDSKSFLKGLDSIIHIEVKKLLPGAETPRFFYKEIEANKIRLEYVSKRNLPSFVTGLLEGLGEYYNEKINVSLLESKEGRYVFEVGFSAGSRKENSAA